MSTLIDERTDEQVVTTDDGDHDRFSHYFRKADIEAAYFDGKTITALCGKQDVPTRDFSKYPVCPMCAEAYQALQA